MVMRVVMLVVVVLVDVDVLERAGVSVALLVSVLVSRGGQVTDLLMSMAQSQDGSSGVMVSRRQLLVSVSLDVMAQLLVLV